jgi:hypothetical protein
MFHIENGETVSAPGTFSPNLPNWGLHRLTITPASEHGHQESFIIHNAYTYSEVMCLRNGLTPFCVWVGSAQEVS